VITITVRLSEAGRKADLLSGGTGEQKRTLTVPHTDPSYAGLLAVAQLCDGGALINQDHSGAPEYDALPTPADVLAGIWTREQAEKYKVAAQLAERREATLAVLRERKVSSGSGHVAQYRPEAVTYVQLTPDWPYYADQSVKESPEAVAWVAELDAQNATARAAAEVESAAKLAALQVEADAKAARIAAKRAERGLADGDLALNIEDGALTQVPAGCWQSHSRGKNWLAIIGTSPASPGGLARDFAPKAKGDSYYLLPDWTAGDALEFGADYYTGSGRKSAKRWYGYVVRIEADYVVLRECSTGKAAVKAGAAHRKTLTPDTQVAGAILRVNGEGAIVETPAE